VTHHLISKARCQVLLEMAVWVTATKLDYWVVTNSIYFIIKLTMLSPNYSKIIETSFTMVYYTSVVGFFYIIINK